MLPLEVSVKPKFWLGVGFPIKVVGVELFFVVVEQTVVDETGTPNRLVDESGLLGGWIYRKLHCSMHGDYIFIYYI